MLEAETVVFGMQRKAEAAGVVMAIFEGVCVRVPSIFIYFTCC